MSKTVQKYQLSFNRDQVLWIPDRCELLQSQIEDGLVSLWLLVDYSQACCTVNVHVRKLGELIDFPVGVVHLGSFSTDQYNSYHFFWNKDETFVSL